MKSKFIALTVPLLIFLLTCPLQSYAKDISETTTYSWEKEVELHDSSIPMKISIPTILTVEGIPDRSKPGESITVKLSTQLIDGAQITVAGEVFGIDDALASSLEYVKDVDLSSVQPLLEKVLSSIIQTELGLDENRSEELASILTEYTHFKLKSRLEVETDIEGHAVVNPRTLQIWFDEPKEEVIKISNNAKDKVSVTYTAHWSILLSIDFTDNVYENPLVGPLIDKLSQLIGLPFEKDLGKIQGTPQISHTITIFALPRLNTTQIAIIIAIIAAACVVGLIILIKHPKKPKWR